MSANLPTSTTASVASPKPIGRPHRPRRARRRRALPSRRRRRRRRVDSSAPPFRSSSCSSSPPRPSPAAARTAWTSGPALASRRHPRSRRAPARRSDRRSACRSGPRRPRPGRRRPGGGPHRGPRLAPVPHAGRVRRRPHRGEHGERCDLRRPGPSRHRSRGTKHGRTRHDGDDPPHDHGPRERDRPYDCATEPDGCVLAVGEMTVPTRGAYTALRFRPGTPLPTPGVTFDPTTGLEDDQPITVTATGLRRSSTYSIAQCTSPTDPVQCGEPALGPQRRGRTPGGRGPSSRRPSTAVGPSTARLRLLRRPPRGLRAADRPGRPSPSPTTSSRRSPGSRSHRPAPTSTASG